MCGRIGISAARRSSSSPSRARVGRDAAQRALVEEVALVVERRDLREVDAGERQRAAAVERGERRRHELAGGREEHGAVERLGRRVGRRRRPTRRRARSARRAVAFASRVMTKTRQPRWRATWIAMCAEAPKP